MIDLNEKLELLNKETLPLWGKMSAQHMVEHLALTIEISMNVFSVECQTAENRIPVMRRILLSEKPLPQDFVNPLIGSELLELKYDSFEESKIELLKRYSEYQIFVKTNPVIIVMHPIFGELNIDEWNIFHKKHFKHHFKQFGIIIEWP